jgi:hypothetical protein
LHNCTFIAVEKSRGAQYGDKHGQFASRSAHANAHDQPYAGGGGEGGEGGEGGSGGPGLSGCSGAFGAFGGGSYAAAEWSSSAPRINRLNISFSLWKCQNFIK